jgi:hypothetical protein
MMERHEGASRPAARPSRRAKRWPLLFATASLLVSALLLASTALFIARPGLAGAVLGPQQGQVDPPQAQFAQPPAWALAPAQPRPGCRYFPETQHNLCFGFRAYWETYGGLLEFGFPLTEEYVDPVLGLTVQWFERARFEWHPGVIPERFDVLEGRVGAELLALGGVPAPPAPTPTPTPTPTPALTIDLTPASDTNAVGTSHTVTAVVERDGAPVSGERVRFRVTGGGSPSPASGSDVTDSDGEATFTFTNSLAATNTIEAWVDLDNDGVRDADEPLDTATKTWTGELSIELTPPSDTNVVGTSHTVTATVERDGDPVSGQRVRFRVTGGGSPSPSSGSDVTNSDGEATFTFSNSQPATNTVEAWIDFDNDGVRDSNEPRDTVTKTWAGTIAITLSPGEDANVVGTQHSVVATVTADGGPLAGVTVRFRVTGGGSPSPSSGSDDTSSSGQAVFSFTNNTVGAENTIEAWVDLDDDSVRDSNEPQATATKTWGGVSITAPSSVARNATGQIVVTAANPTMQQFSARFRVTVDGPQNCTNGDLQQWFDLTAGTTQVQRPTPQTINHPSNEVEGFEDSFTCSSGNLVAWWGPDGGFPMPADYLATTTFAFSVNSSAPTGTYTVTVELVNVGTNQTLATRTATVRVT